jgi:hypothetical protein
MTPIRFVSSARRVGPELAPRALLAERIEIAETIRPPAPPDGLRLDLAERAAALRAAHGLRREREGVSPGRRFATEGNSLRASIR